MSPPDTQPPPRALITGATGGIGAALAVHLAQRGWSLDLVHQQPSPRVGHLLDRLRGHVAPVTLHAIDLADGTATLGLAKALLQGDPITAVIHAGGAMPRAALLTASLDSLRHAYAVHAEAFVALCQTLGPAMVERGHGRIVALGHATVSRLSAPPAIAGYYAAKAAQLAYVRAFARQFAGTGVTVNAVAPGVIDSGGMPRSDLEALVAKSPAGAIGAVDDIVSAIDYLLSDAARHVQGAEWVVAGAWGL